MTEREKMVAGKLYDPADEELARMRRDAHRLCHRYNAAFEDEEELREAILRELLPQAGADCYLQGPIYFDYGVNVTTGKNFYANFNLTVLDCAPVIIGDDVQFGPNITLATPIHPLRYQERNWQPWPDGRETAKEFAKPIVIEDNCWLASNVVVTGGCRVGMGSVIGAGSVVTRDIPAGVLAAGNPCRVIRAITEEDALPRKENLW